MAFSADISSTAAAPSEICEALPAVILPSGLNAGFSCESASRFVSGRMPWSVTYVSPSTVIGTISRSKRPSSVAWWASRCERTASSSSSERGISHWSAIISAPRPWPTMLCLAISSGGERDAELLLRLHARPRTAGGPCARRPSRSSRRARPRRSAPAAKLTACWAEPHWRSTVVPGVSIGRPSCSHALRATFRPCSPNCETQPAITSSTSRGVDARALDHLGVDSPEQRVRVDVLVVALLLVPAADRRAHRLDDHDFAALWLPHVSSPPTECCRGDYGEREPGRSPRRVSARCLRRCPDPATHILPRPP